MSKFVFCDRKGVCAPLCLLRSAKRPRLNKTNMSLWDLGSCRGHLIRRLLIRNNDSFY